MLKFVLIFRTVEAHEALHKLYGSNYRVSEEVEIIQDNLSKLRENRSRKISYIRNLRKHPEIYQPFLIIVTLSIIQQFSGMSILRTYVVKIFDQVFHTLPSGSDTRLLKSSLINCIFQDIPTDAKCAATL